ncbi:MAG TPA: DoxX family protein [Chloroflexota bacterium]|nr:DoxX family protein [Chloroflexota bacterium]
MNVALWIVQGLLALAYLFAGAMKATQPLESLGKSMNWVHAVPLGFVRFIGVAELLGALGLVLPLATGILPWLTVAAAVGLIVVQVGAAIFHVSRQETSKVPINLVLLILAVFVAYGRTGIAPL